MSKKEWEKFLKTGSIKDYLDYRKAIKNFQEIAVLGEKNDNKRRSNNKDSKV